MKKIAVIGASYLQMPLVRKAKEVGYEVHCFAWDKDAVCKEIADRFYPISITEKDVILEKCREIGIDGICTIASDVAAPTVAYVAERLNLNANSYESACRANNKFEMRKALDKAGVLCPKYRCVTDTDTLLDTDWIFPIIVKPSDRSGSLGVAKVYSLDELKKAVATALEFSFKGEAMLEEFIEGREISVEFISYHGKHYPLQITDKVTTEAPHFVELEHHQPADLSKETFNHIYELTEKALNALGLTDGASHSEYKITRDGRIVVMEIGGRMGGDFIGSDLVRLSTGYDFVKGVIEVALDSFLEPTFKTPRYSGVYFLCEETKGLLPIFHYHDQYPEIKICEQTDTELRNIECSADRSGYFIYQSTDKFKVKK
ncbi:MAG: ATP-grasp domain-containing protein [Muribaculaceae bacterium]|nr:ATP-grasp domain-containing protein [Muribaculaceae bacterium]